MFEIIPFCLVSKIEDFKKTIFSIRNLMAPKIGKVVAFVLFTAFLIACGLAGDRGTLNDRFRP